MQTQEKQAVIDAINELGRRVTPADVASKTGMPLARATAELNKVAAETNGHLEVSTVGDVVYKFDSGFESMYVASGIAKFIETACKKVFEILFFLVRISFGIALILSFLTILILVIAIIFAMSRGENSDSGGFGDFGFDFNFFDYMILRDLLFWGAWSNPYPGYGGYGYGYDGYSTRPSQLPGQKSNFLFNCFSFLFGDGNPNKFIDKRKWQLIARRILENGNVITAEELAPYTGADPKNEDGVLPVLARFEGRPEVTETGNIVYVFPNMQAHAASEEAIVDGTAPPVFLNEAKWKFTNASAEGLIPVYILAALNFGGAWWLYLEATKYTTLLHGLVPLAHVLVIYGTLFLAIPVTRYCILQCINATIETRNEERQTYAAQVQTKSDDLARKLTEAASFRTRGRNISAKDIYYTTEKDALDQRDALDEQFEREFGAGQPHAAEHGTTSQHHPSHHDDIKRIGGSPLDDGGTLGNNTIDISEKNKQERS